MLTTVLVPLDGSPLAERALPYAAALARPAGARLWLLHVNTAIDSVLGLRQRAAERDVTLAMGRHAAALREQGIEVEARTEYVPQGDVALAIAAVAHELRADLIVMSTHGRGGIGRLLHGSVADRLLRTAEVPLLLIPTGCQRAWPEEGPQRILVPLDGSELAEAALGPAVELAELLGADLHLLQAVEASYQVLYPPATYVPLESERGLDIAERYLQAIAEMLRVRRLAVSVEARADQAAAAIAEVAQARGCDLIAMATHGRGGLARLVLGSVATSTLQRAQLPVLLVRPPAASPAAPESETATPEVEAAGR